MNPDNHTATWLKRAAMLCIATGATAALAQTVIVPPPVHEPPPPGPQRSGQAETDSVEEMAIGEALQPRDLFQWGPVRLHPGVSYRFMYGEGIRTRVGRTDETIIQTLTPGIRADIGDRWHFNYRANMSFYSDSAFEDSVGHSFNFGGGTTYEAWSFGFSQSGHISSEVHTETARQTDEQDYNTSLTAGYQINSLYSLDLSVRQHVRVIEGFTSSVGNAWTWSTMDWLNLQLTPYLATSIGLGAGYTDVEHGSDMTFQEARGRVGLQLTKKLNLSANAGAEIRQFRDSDKDPKVSPVFGVTASYHPIEPTTISLSARRSIAASHFRDQITERTSLTLNLSQRLLLRYHLGVSGGIHYSTYEASSSMGTGGREDTQTFLSTSLGTALLRRGSISVFYSISRNTSNRTGFDYTSNQMGFQVSYSY